MRSKKRRCRVTLSIINIMHILGLVKYWASNAKVRWVKKKQTTNQTKLNKTNQNKPTKTNKKQNKTKKGNEHASRDLHKADLQHGQTYVR